VSPPLPGAPRRSWGFGGGRRCVRFFTSLDSVCECQCVRCWVLTQWVNEESRAAGENKTERSAWWKERKRLLRTIFCLFIVQVCSVDEQTNFVGQTLSVHPSRNVIKSTSK
jgi:hypothetical protein